MKSWLQNPSNLQLSVLKQSRRRMVPLPRSCSRTLPSDGRAAKSAEKCDGGAFFAAEELKI
ncbi:hypothetical protein ABID19_000374 [Mesorhizobium robiniae]|uniref:Propionyl-coenzyme A carboxylase alpha polypeptide n=1 Tax=Mesorhizobium robiniae TaxID=559315 RepID=A0ABV2GGT5_9HYPH